MQHIIIIFLFCWGGGGGQFAIYVIEAAET